jgi:ribosome biogenesis GTPase
VSLSVRTRRGPEGKGTVIRLQSRHALVRMDSGSVHRCTLRKALFHDESRFTRPVAVGDRVRVTVFGPRDAVVEEVLPRRRYLARLQQETGREQILVANVDQVLITVSLREPEFRPRIIDRILIAAERGGFDALIALNKVDLVEDRTPFEERASLYRDLGYSALFVSAQTGEGILELADALTDKTTVLTGQSGVGKSTLLNAIQPGLGLKAREVSAKWGKGRHTTSATSLLPLDRGGFVVDTPGIRSWAIAGLEATDIAIFFRDFEPFIESCHFSACTHDHEPGCAVLAAVEEGRIHPDRYDSYLRIIGGMDDEADDRS